jgi:hypothetical protein
MIKSSNTFLILKCEYVTQEFTIRDLLTHRSGLGLGAGDLMIWPDGSNFTATDTTKLVFKASFRIQNQI